MSFVLKALVVYVRAIKYRPISQFATISIEYFNHNHFYEPVVSPNPL